MAVFNVFIKGAIFEDFFTIPYATSCLVFFSSFGDVSVCLCSGIVVSVEEFGWNSWSLTYGMIGLIPCDWMMVSDVSHMSP